MRARLLRTLVPCVIAAAPAWVTALDVTGRVGVAYSRSTFDPPEGPSVTEPHLDVDLGLDARGVVVRPEVVDWKLGAAYRRISDDTNGARTRLQERFFYDGRATLFGNPASAATLRLNGSRTQSDFSTNVALDVFGSSVTDQAGATLTIRPGSIPPVVGGYAYRRLEENVPGLPTHERETHAFQASIASGSPTHRFSGTYLGELNDGTFAADQYDLHGVSVQAGAPLAGKAELVIDERFTQLQPKTTALGAIAQDNNVFRLSARDRGLYGDRHVLEYLYSHALTETPTSPLAEATRNSLRYEGDHLLTSPALFTRWSLDLSLGSTRLGTTSVDASGETAGVQLWWRRTDAERTYEILGGPLVGLIQSDADGDDVGYGASAAARFTRPWGAQLAHLAYDVAYARDLFAIAGWNVRQSLTGQLGGRLGLGRYSAVLRGSTVRSHSPLLGDGATRLVEAYSTVELGRFDFELRGLLESGIANTAAANFVSDGLFIPPPFDTSNRQLSLRAGARVLPGLTARAHARVGSSARPGQPTIEQTEVIGALDYQYAALVVSVENRVDWFEQPTGTAMRNTVFVRLHRRLDWRF